MTTPTPPRACPGSRSASGDTALSAGGSRRGSALQAAVGDLHGNLQHVRGRSRDPAADGDPIASAIEDVLDQAEPPGNEEAVTACLLCRTIGPCLSVQCPRTHGFRVPVTGQVPVFLTALKKAPCEVLPDQANLLNPVPELPLAQAFIIVELWVSALLDHKHRLKDDVVVSLLIWTGCDLLVLLTSYRDPVVIPAGRVGVLLSFRHGVLPRKDGLGTPPFLGFFYSYTLRRHPKTLNTNTTPSMHLLWGTLGPGSVMPNFAVFLETPFWATTPLGTPLPGQEGGFVVGSWAGNPPFLDPFLGKNPPS